MSLKELSTFDGWIQGGDVCAGSLNTDTDTIEGANGIYNIFATR